MVYCKKETELSLIEAETLLCEVDTTRVSTQAARKPKGGEIYIYRCDDTPAKIHWVADGYRWLHVGCDRLPRSCPILYKRKFQTVESSGESSYRFKRVAYSHIGASADPSSAHYVLVHYTGDESVAEDLPRAHVKKRRKARPLPAIAPRTSDIDEHHLLATVEHSNIHNQPYHLIKVKNVQVEVNSVLRFYFGD